MGTKGDSGTGTRQESTTEETHQPSPINTDDSAVTLRKGTAAREKWELFSTKKAATDFCEQFVHHAYVCLSSIWKKVMPSMYS